MPQPEAAPVVPASSTAAASHDLTAAAEHALLHGNGLARAILSQPGIEGDPLAFLKATEAYWKVGACTQCSSMQGTSTLTRSICAVVA
jgi:hypothetical protein